MGVATRNPTENHAQTERGDNPCQSKHNHRVTVSLDLCGTERAVFGRLLRWIPEAVRSVTSGPQAEHDQQTENGAAGPGKLRCPAVVSSRRR
jgi:hypothetical protein